MRRLLTIVVFMVIAGSARAEILSTVAGAMYRARADLNVDTTDTEYLSNAEAGHRIKEAVSLINRLVGDNRTNTTIPMAINTYVYHLPDSSAADTLNRWWESIVSVQFVRADTIKTLLRVPRAMWYEKDHQFSKGSKGLLAHPSYYDYYDDSLYVFPVPSRVDTLTVTTTDKITSLNAITTLISIDEVYRPAIVKYVVYETAKARQHPMVLLYKQDYERLWGLLFPRFNPQVPNAQ